MNYEKYWIKYKEEENTKVEITEVDGRSFINYEYVFWLENMLVKNLSLSGVSQQRELLNALADDFNDSTDTYVGQPRIEKILKAFNCG